MSERVPSRPSVVNDVLTGLRRPRARAPRIIGALTYVVGLSDLVSGLRPALRPHLHLLSELLPGVIEGAATAATVVTGIFMLVLAHALRRRKRRAWRMTVALLVISVVLHVIKLEPLALAISLTVLVTLLAYRAEFRALGDPGTRWRAVQALLALGVTSIGLGVVVIELARRHVVGGHPPLTAVLQEVFAGLVGLDGPVRFDSDRMGDIVGAVLLGLGLMTLLTPTYLALRSPEPRPRLTEQDQARMRELLRRRGDSLGYFNLRVDKSVVWSESGKAAIAYRVVSGVMLASGDPLGDPEAWPGAIHAFLREAEAHAWTPAVLGCSEHAGTVWCRESGLSALEMGDEAVVDARCFSLEGRAMRNVRQMVRRIERAGYTTEVVRARDLSEGDRRRALADAEAWRGSETERGFSMALGRLADPADPECIVALARQDGLMRGMLQFVPWGEDGMSLDIMRRDRDAEPGVNELLIAHTLQAAAGLGITRVSLNFAVFRSTLARGERLGAGPVLRGFRGMLLFASRWFQIESLYRFNAKFQPVWVPRFLLYPSAGDMPRVALAALEAEAFLVWPRMHWLGEVTP